MPLPLDPAAWVARPCSARPRSLSSTEWARRYSLTCDHVLEGIIVGERHDTSELVGLGAVDNTVRVQLLTERQGLVELATALVDVQIQKRDYGPVLVPAVDGAPLTDADVRAALERVRR